MDLLLTRLATCLAQDTGVLRLDEPTTFLDLRYQIEILDLMRDLADEHGVAVGVVLHDLNQAAAVADRIALLDQGRVRATGTPEDGGDLAGNAIWKNLPFVKSGNVHRLPDGIWMFGGPKSTQQFIDATVQAVTS